MFRIIPFLSLEELQGDVLDDDEDKEDDNKSGNYDNHFGVECNSTAYNE